MKKIFIKYNPYKLETEMMVDGEELAPNSQLRDKVMPGIRLQEWIEELPSLLAQEYACREWKITFHGTLLDFQDLKEVFDFYNKKGELTTTINYIPAKETSHKIGLIDEVFQEIQNGPFEELKDEEIRSAFQHAKSSEFEVCVVATMSAGKSTLINAMLGAKLMPSKQEACTAIITRIKDNDNQSWKAKVYSQDNRLLETHEELTYKKMVRLNDEEEVSIIEVNGDIPFVDSENISLVLIDTPGPNNSRDPEHKKVQSEFLSKSSKSLVLYIMDGTFGTDDDHQLLKQVADSMAVAGKQSKDRFIFVVNKMDTRSKDDGPTNETLNRIREYLERHAINNPNLFPVAALPALNIKLITSGTEVDDEILEETELKVKRLNRNEQLHLESYATLPLSIKNEIARQLYEAEGTKDDTDQALIHTGIVSLEAAIRQYVEKYAETAKIKNIVDTFIHKLDEVGCFEETKRKLSENKYQNEKIVAQINTILQKIEDIHAAQNFENDVKEAIDQVNKHSQQIIDDIKLEFQKIITLKIEQSQKRGEVPIDHLNKEKEELEKFAKRLEPEFRVKLDELISENLIETGNALLQSYRKKLTNIVEEMNDEVFSDITIDPLKLMSGSVNLSYEGLNSLIKVKQVEDGEEWVENTDKKWYKPWTWFDEDGYYRKKYNNVNYIEAVDIAQQYFTKVQKAFNSNVEEAYKYALTESEKIVERFNMEFKRLDNVLKEKLFTLEKFATEKEQVEERIRECESNLKWLKKIKRDVESILEI